MTYCMQIQLTDKIFELLREVMGRKDEGRRLIEKGLTMENTDKDDPQVKHDGEQVLAKLK
jgi:hypothetical protein